MGDSAKMEEFLQMEADNNRLRSQIKMLERVVEEYEEAESVPKAGPSDRENQLERDLKLLRQRIEEQTVEIDDLTKTNTKLESSVHKLNDELKNVPPPRPASPENDDVLEDALTKIKELTHKLNDLETLHFDLAQEMRVRETQIKELEKDNREKEDELSHLIEDGRNQIGVISDLREQIHELNAELAESKLGGHAARGNSMFAEFVDERKNIENDLRTVHRQVVKFRRENILLRRELEDSNRRAKMFSVREVKGRCRCSSLEIEMNNEREKVTILESKIREFGNRIFDNVMKCHGKLPSDLIFLKSEHVRLTSDNEILRKERNTVVDELDIQSVKLECAQKSEAHLRNALDMMEGQNNSYREQIEELINGKQESDAESDKESSSTAPKSEPVPTVPNEICDPNSENKTAVNPIKAKEVIKCPAPMKMRPIRSGTFSRSAHSTSVMAPPLCTPAKTGDLNKTYSTPASVMTPAQEGNEEIDRERLLFKSYAIQHRERLQSKKPLSETPLKADINIAIQAETPAQKQGQRPPRAKPMLNPARNVPWKTIVMDFKDVEVNSSTAMNNNPLKTPLKTDAAPDSDEPATKKPHIEGEQENVLPDLEI